MQKIFLSLLALFSLNAFGMELINARAVSSAQDVKLWSSNNHLFVEDENAAYRVEKYNMSPLLKEVMERQAMGKFTDGGYIRVKQLSDGKYALEAKVRGLGGGLAGTTIGVMSGKFIVHFTAQLAILTVGAGIATVNPPAGAAFVYAAEKATVPLIESASTIAAIGLGIFGGLVTGPV